MPKTQMDYSKTIIYKLVCNDLSVNHIYVGHTTNFKERKRHHKDSCNIVTARGHHLKLYQVIRANGGWDNWSMIEIEKFPCLDRNEATAKERHYYEQLQADLNIAYPGRTQREYSQLEHCKLKKKEYQETHKPEKAEYDKMRRELLHDKLNEKKVCDCGGKYLSRHKSTHFKTTLHLNWFNLTTTPN